MLSNTRCIRMPCAMQYDTSDCDTVCRTNTPHTISATISHLQDVVARGGHECKDMHTISNRWERCFTRSAHWPFVLQFCLNAFRLVVLHLRTRLPRAMTFDLGAEQGSRRRLQWLDFRAPQFLSRCALCLTDALFRGSYSSAPPSVRARRAVLNWLNHCGFDTTEYNQ